MNNIKMIYFVLFCGIAAVPVLSEIGVESVPPYIKQCYEGDPQVVKCFINGMYHLQPYLARGIKEIELPSVEPFMMEELSLSLTSGPNGYKVSLKDIKVYGASNFTVQKLALSENGKPFEVQIKIPVLRIHARYESSGVLIILPASGNGTFNGKFENITAKMKGMVSKNRRNGKEYLHVETLAVGIDAKRVNMAVKNVYKNNRILGEAINLFLRDNAHDLFNVMNPQLTAKLSMLFKSISNQLLVHVPLNVIYVPK